MPGYCPALPAAPAARLWKTFRSKPNAIPVQGKTVRLATGIGVHLQTGIAFTFDRIPQGWRGAAIQGLMAPTPSWESTRHAKFMKTDNAQPHFWMLEDVELRCKVAADLLDKASDLSKRLPDELPNLSDRVQFEQIQKNVDIFCRVSRSYALHLRETNVAQMLRQDLAATRPMTAALVKQLGQLLDSDVANQDGRGRVVEMRRLYLENPAAFLRRYLIPVDGTPTEKEPFSRDLPLDFMQTEKGPFTLTTR